MASPRDRGLLHARQYLGGDGAIAEDCSDRAGLLDSGLDLIAKGILAAVTFFKHNAEATAA